jgi:hypothetical protein
MHGAWRCCSWQMVLPSVATLIQMTESPSLMGVLKLMGLGSLVLLVHHKVKLAGKLLNPAASTVQRGY